MTSIVISSSALPIIIAPSSNILHSQYILIQFASVCSLLGLSRFFDGSELNKGIVPLHINSYKFAKWFKKHLQIFLLGSFFLKVDNKESFRWLDILAAVIFFALDPAITSCKFCSKSRRQVLDFPDR
jgi:hypothetical protein